jgi:hypothetical protein
MEQFDGGLRETRIMGQWTLDMKDPALARQAIDSLPEALHAVIEARLSIWGVQVRTDNEAAALWLKTHYQTEPLTPETPAPEALVPERLSLVA